MNTTTLRVAAVAALALAAACRKAPTPAPAPAPVAQAPAADDGRERARLDSIARAEAARADSVARAEAARRAREAAIAAAATELTRMVHFDYDADALRPDATTLLDAKLPILRANPAVRLRIGGHADDRGSDEYNLALGQRRAAAVMRYLTARGVEASRFDTESFGEQRPLCTDGQEGCWQRNRRAEFTVAMGSVTAPPTP